MKTNDEEALADVTIKVLEMENSLKDFFADLKRRMAQADRRNDLSIARLVKLESRAEAFDKKLELSIVNLEQTHRNLEQTNKNLELFGRKLEKSIKDQEASSRRQAEINEYFLKQIRKNSHK